MSSLPDVNKLGVLFQCLVLHITLDKSVHFCSLKSVAVSTLFFDYMGGKTASVTEVDLEGE